MADATQDPFTAGMVNLAETAKWLVGGIVGAAAGVLAGSPLTNLGALGFGLRLGAALLGAATAYVLLGVLLWYALDVISSRTTSFARLMRGEGANAAALARIEAQMAPVLPPDAKTFAALRDKSALLVADHSRGSDARYAAFSDLIAGLEPQLGFEYKRDRFEQLKKLIFKLMPFVIVGVWIFAWAANPKSAPAPTDAPRYVQLPLDADTAALIAKGEGDGCHVALKAGGTARALVIGEDEDGRTQLVTSLPEGLGCPPIRLLQQNGRVFTGK